MKFLQANIHHAKAASDTFCSTFCANKISIGLIQEPWVSRGKICGLSSGKCKLLYDHTTQVPRAAIMVDANIRFLLLSEFCSKDQVAIVVDVPITGGFREVVCASAYFSAEDVAAPAIVQSLID